MNKIVKYILLPLFILSVGLSRVSYIAQAENIVNQPTLTVTYFDQPYENFVAYRAELAAPIGTEIQVRNSGLYVVEDESEPYVFTLTHHLSSSPRDDWPPNNRSENSFVESLMLTKQIQESESYTFIPNSSTGLESFSSVRGSVSFVRPGTYTLREGERFVLSKIESEEFYFDVIKVPR